MTITNCNYTNEVMVGILVLLVCLLFSTASYSDQIPLFDSHVHYSADVWEAIPPQDAIVRLKKNGIRRAIVSATPAKGARKLFEAEPELVIPFLRPYRSPADRNNWYKNPEILEFIKMELKEFNYRGLGEFHLFGSQVNTPVMKDVLALAKTHKLVLLTHSNHETVDALFSAAPSLTIIWAHGGFDVDTQVITDKLERHKNLYIELSFREGIVENGKLTEQWRNIFMTYPTRFLVGTDTYTGQRWLQQTEITQQYQDWLKQLPENIATLIAFKNGQSLFPKNP